MKLEFKKIIPHLAAIALFLIISFAYFSPLLKGKAIKQGDVTHYIGASKEIADFREKFNEEPLWTNSMFGGMPSYQISVKYEGHLMKYVDNVIRLGLPRPSDLLFLYLLGFYFLLCVLKIDSWLSFLGAVAFALSSYFFVIIEAGHNSKALAIGYMAPVFAGVILAMRDNKHLLGAAVTALFLALEISVNHLQITYYLAIFIGFYLLFSFYNSVKQNMLPAFFKASAYLALAMVLAVGANASGLLINSQYVKHTMRGQSDLTMNKEKKSGGLDKDYATSWSYGKSETMTLLIPNYKGGASGYIGMEKGALDKVDRRFSEYIAKSDRYWGDQPFTSGPVYAGALVMAIFLLGLFIIKDNFKWLLLAATVFFVFLSWGKNFMWFTDLMFDYFPGYNKFRSVSMALVIPEFTIPLLFTLTLHKIIETKTFLTEAVKLPLVKNPIKQSSLFMGIMGFAGVLCLLMYLMPTTFNTFYKSNEYNEMYSQITQSSPPDVANDFLANLQTARIAIFKPDAIRSFAFIALGLLVLWYYIKSRFDKRLLIATLSVFVIADMWNVNRRYLNNDSFVDKQKATQPFKLSAASAEILKDKSSDYRVLNLAVNTFNDAGTSYFHHSVGGYSAAKLGRYQDMIDFHISPSIQNIISTLKNKPTDSIINTTLAQQHILNMLNSKYIIYNEEAPPLTNPFAYGPAWFVNNIKVVENADSEITALSIIDPRVTAVVDKKFENVIMSPIAKPDTDATIKQTEYRANCIKYETKASSEQVAVFSEIYYADGWNAYLDGNKTDYFRANYILRGMRVPAGTHKIEFKFEPELYHTGGKIALTSSILIFVLAGYSAFDFFRKKTVNQ